MAETQQVVRLRRTQVRRVCFTLNNYTPAQVTTLNNLMATEAVDYLCYGKEVGEQGTPHLQGVMFFGKPMDFSTISSWIPQMHLEKMQARGKKQVLRAINYCKKGEQPHDEWRELGTMGPNYGKNAEVFEAGTYSYEGKRSDIWGAVAEMDTRSERGDDFNKILRKTNHVDVYIRYPRGMLLYFHALRCRPRRSKPVVYWFYGPTGTGKTATAIAMRKTPDGYWISGETGRWFQAYCGQELAIFDDIRKDFAKFRVWLRLLDRYPYEVEVKGGSVAWNPSRIVITAPTDPREFWRRRDLEGSISDREDIGQLLRRIDYIVCFADETPTFSKFDERLGEYIPDESVDHALPQWQSFLPGLESG